MKVRSLGNGLIQTAFCLAALAVTAAGQRAGASTPTLPRNDQASRALLEIVGEGFRIRRTDHFTIAYNTSYDVLRPLIGRLEGTYDAIWGFCQGGGLGIHPPPARLQVILFDGQDEYRAYRKGLGLAPEAAAGFYSPETNLAVFSNTLRRDELRGIAAEIDAGQMQLDSIGPGSSNESPGRRERSELQRRVEILRARRDALVERFNRFVLQHEVAHQVLFNIGVHTPGAANPAWLAEGLACQFEVFQAGSGKGFRGVNHLRLADLRDSLDVSLDAKNASDEQYRDAFESGRLVPLAELIADDKAFTVRDADLAYRYAQAWGLVFYLSREHREGFGAYLKLLSKRLPGEVCGGRREVADFKSAFGPVDDHFQRTWVDYLLELRFDRPKAGR